MCLIYSRFTYDPLTFDDLVSLHNAATYYRFPHVITLVKRHLERIFPSNFFSLDQPLMENAPEAALTIGTKYGIKSIRQHACYDLARAPAEHWSLTVTSDVPVTVPTLSGIYPTFGTTTIIIQADPLTSVERHCVRALQGHLLSAWNKIHTGLRSLTFRDPACDCCTRNRLTLSDRVADVMYELPYDPLQGMRILATDESIIRVLCKKGQASVKDFIKNKEALIIQALEAEWTALI